MSDSCCVTDVFGLRRDVLSYVERDHVDKLFKIALQTDKQILVYGASKQGKTALVNKHCPPEQTITYQLTPDTQLVDIYQYVLREAGVLIRTEYTEGEGGSASLSVKAKIKATFAIFASGEAGLEGSAGLNYSQTSKHQELPFNIEQPQQISSLLKRVKNKKIIVLDNFHYLTLETQKAFSFDLRAFQELGVRFIILGVWRERNRMLQFNGDLLDRVKEIPVEPWSQDDFQRILKKGESLLNIEFSPEIASDCCELSFSSVGVFQDLLQGVCLAAGVNAKQPKKTMVDQTSALRLIVHEKAESYGDRHKRSFESIASCTKQSGGMEKYYYTIVDIILEGGFAAIENGVTHDTVFDKILHRTSAKAPGKVMIRNALAQLHKIQSEKSITPPILYFDENTDTLSISDSTLYFFLKNSNLVDFRARLKSSYGNKI